MKNKRNNQFYMNEYSTGSPLQHDMEVDPRDRGLLPLVKAIPEETEELRSCCHTRLVFTDGQFKVKCYDCKQEWRAVRSHSPWYEVELAYDMGSRETPPGLRVFDETTMQKDFTHKVKGRAGNPRKGRLAGLEDIPCAKNGCKLILCHKGKCDPG